MTVETDISTFAADNINGFLAWPKGESYVYEHYGIVSSVFYRLQNTSWTEGLCEPDEPLKVPPARYLWIWWRYVCAFIHPKKHCLFSTHMELQRNLITNWDTLSSLVRSMQLMPEEILFVDAGGTGHQLRRIWAELPPHSWWDDSAESTKIIVNAEIIPVVSIHAANFLRCCAQRC
jgi:hypothetical protein